MATTMRMRIMATTRREPALMGLSVGRCTEDGHTIGAFLAV